MSGTAFEIPLVPRPQQLNVVLSGVTYQLTVRPNDAAQCWVLDMYDDLGGPVALGMALTTGVDLLSQLQYLGIGGQLWVISDVNPLATPTFVNLGTGSHLLFVPD